MWVIAAFRAAAPMHARSGTCAATRIPKKNKKKENKKSPHEVSIKIRCAAKKMHAKSLR